MDTTTITGGADGGTGEEGLQPYWDVIWDKLFPDGWFTGDAPATGNARFTSSVRNISSMGNLLNLPQASEPG